MQRSCCEQGLFLWRSKYVPNRMLNKAYNNQECVRFKRRSPSVEPSVQPAAASAPSSCSDPKKAGNYLAGGASLIKAIKTHFNQESTDAGKKRPLIVYAPPPPKKKNHGSFSWPRWGRKKRSENLKVFGSKNIVNNRGDSHPSSSRFFQQRPRG